MNYQDHLTKFTLLRPLKTKTAEEVVYYLVDIFCIFGAPFTLQSDNDREFSNKIIKNMTELWPGMKLVHGKPRHSQSQGFVERLNQDVREMLVSWMADNRPKNWSEGLRFIQSKKNRALHVGIKMSPYEAMFGSPQIARLADSPLTENVYSNIETEEELEELLKNINNNNELQSLDDVGDCDENKENVEDSSKVYCIICEKESSGAHKCSECDNFVHVICGKSTSEGKRSIRTEQNNAKNNLKKLAEKMLALSNSKFTPAEIGTSVVVRVPDIDRGRLAPKQHEIINNYHRLNYNGIEETYKHLKRQFYWSKMKERDLGNELAFQP
ncbi:SCAN domain-containing protein 3-like [Agrilus planipennis]|uniref:RNA-directed DNA polymerase n=1 Tax=Agrilus planipennis TaxID=224129 RepID=A0A7F5R4P8_AGRPL|nr:SCAN domain-containing protein 3-like [Agrilus planipennis]